LLLLLLLLLSHTSPFSFKSSSAFGEPCFYTTGTADKVATAAAVLFWKGSEPISTEVAATAWLLLLLLLFNSYQLRRQRRRHSLLVSMETLETVLDVAVGCVSILFTIPAVVG
jgi:hypothetical protein